MRIVMISDQYPPIVGGYERQAERLSRELVRRGHRVIVFTGRWSSNAPAVETVQGVEVRRLQTLHEILRFPGTRRFRHDVYARNLAKSLCASVPEADVIHVHSIRRGAVVALEVGRAFGVPVLVKEPNSGLRNTFLELESEYRGPSMRRFLLRELRHLAVLNADAERQYREQPFRDLTIHRAFNGIDLDAYPMHDPVEPPIILALCRLRPEKALHVLVQAFAEIAKTNPDWRLRICGNGPELPRLRHEIRRLGLDSKAELVGHVDAHALELARASLLVVSSLAEGMSNTLLEAIAVGTPAIATDVGSNAEILRDGAGWIVPANDVPALARAIQDAIADRSARSSRSTLARRRAQEYSISAAADRYEQIYRTMGVRA